MKNPSGVVVNTFNTQSGSVSLPLIGDADTIYTASCYVNNQTTTPAVCQKTLTIDIPGSSSGGPTPVCNDIIKNSSGSYTCFGNQYTDLFAMQCGTNADGNPIYLGPKDAVDSGEAGGRKIAQFDCSAPYPRCYAADPGATISQITNADIWKTSDACTIQSNHCF